MKNIHLIPTDKLSRLYEFGGEYHLQIKSQENFRSQNIYITSDEEIKDGDWIIYKNKVSKIERGDNELFHLSKKIILTTDQDLINDGVQAIDDEFLVWFVNNPSCERVEVRKIGEEWIYNADVPKEPKQETIEEALNYQLNFIHDVVRNKDFDLGFQTGGIFGAKWQAERMYSEEDMTNYAMFILLNKLITPKEWFEQFKKK
jgi:hypothetical protein